MTVDEWTCHICKAVRPDMKIAVLTKDLSKEYGLPPGTVRANVRYCKDRADCSEEAEKFKFKNKK